MFRETIGRVRPIRNDKVSPLLARKPQPFPGKRHAADSEQALDRTAPVEEILGVEDTLSFLGSGVQKNVLKKLRRGYYGLDAEIDLHGLNSGDAHRQLQRFLRHCREQGCRCIRIVHGKGYRSQDRQPVLKNHLNAWLRQQPAVQAFCSAPPRQGGAGAVLVLLRLTDKYGEQDDA